MKYNAAMITVPSNEPRRNSPGGSIRVMMTIVPPVIGEHVGTLLSAIADNSRGLEKLRLLKTGLMQNFFTGKVRVTPLLQKERKAATA